MMEEKIAMLYVKNKLDPIGKIKIAKILALVVLSAGILVTIGWFLDIDYLKSILPTFVTMKFSTAISFVFSGVILYFISSMKEGRVGMSHIALPVAGLLIMLFMATIMVSVLFDINTGMEKLFMKEMEGAVKTTVTGRPSIPTILNFILIVASCVFALSDLKLKKLLLGIGSTVTAIGGVSIVGYVIDLPVLYYSVEDVSTAMALHTSILFVVLGVGMILLGTIQESQKEIKSIKIKTKLMSLFIITSIIPIIFVGAMSYDIARDPAAPENLGNSILIIGSIVAIVMAIFSFVISKSLSRPITKLGDIAGDLAKGNFNVKAMEYSNDEIGELGKAVNHMVENISEADNQKATFSTMITHELKTPLMPILGYSKMLKKPDMIGTLNEEQLKAVDTIEKNTQRLEKLIYDILDARKLDIRKLKFVINKFSIKQLIDELESSYEQPLKQKEIKFSIKHNIENQTLHSDKNRLRQVLDNLIGNTIKAVLAKVGEIEVGVNQKDSQMNFYVRDNGIGIPSEKQNDIFKKFYQVDSTLTRKNEGSGLGLNICKGIVEGLGGKIWFESKEGKGTTFYFSIPINTSLTENNG